MPGLPGKTSLTNIQVDFTCAFNTIDHDKLLQTLYDLGFPSDAIDVVKDLYTGATTKIKFSDVTTSALTVDRGSIQGDSLSPFLFLCMMEPLLRWLQVGGRGYTFGCINDSAERIKNHVSNAAFADDLSILTTSLPNLHIQADKLTRYADWAHLEVNTDKTTVSGLLYRNLARSSPYGRKDAIAQVRAQLENQIVVQGRHVKYLDPREPFRYLGANLTLTLDWKFHHQILLKKAKEKIERLIAFRVSPQQIQHVIKTCIKPSIVNTFGVIPMTKTDIHILDRVINQAIRQANGLPPRTPTAFIHEDESAFGLGSESLLVDYAHKHATLFIESLRDQGKMGVISKALLSLQLRLNQTSPHQTKYCLRVRQLAMLRDSEVSLLKDDIPQFDVPTSIVQSLQHLNPHNTSTPTLIPCEFLQPLLKLGITSLADLLEPGATHVIDGHTLKRSIWGRNVRAKHVAALNRLARLLNEGPGRDNDIASILRHRDSALDLASSSRKIHPENTHITSMAINTLIEDTPAPTTHLDQALITDFLRKEGRLPVGPLLPAQVMVDSAIEHQASDNLPPSRGKRKAYMKGPTLHRDKQYKQQTRIRTSVDPIPNPQTHISASCPCQSHSYKRSLAEDQMRSLKGEQRCKAAKVVDTLYGHTTALEAILSWRMVTEEANKGKRNRKDLTKRTEKIKQIQYLTQWAPTYVETWALPLFELAGYRYKSQTPVQRSHFAGKDNDALTDACIAACEVCFNPWSLEKTHDDDDGGAITDDKFACDNCHKHYHTRCLGQPHGWVPPTSTWHCPACTNLPRGESPPEDLIRVEWEPTWEPEETLRSTRAGQVAIENWIRDNHDQPPTRINNPPLDLHLSNLERQGASQPTEMNKWKSTMGDQIRNRVIIETQAINPQLDIHPTRECKVEIRHSEVLNPLKPESPTTMQLACFYAPDGKCVGTRTVERLVTLRQLHDQHTNTQHANNNCISFAADAIDLIRRHRPRKDDPLALRHWRVPSNVRHVITRHFHTTTERFTVTT